MSDVLCAVDSNPIQRQSPIPFLLHLLSCTLPSPASPIVIRLGFVAAFDPFYLSVLAAAVRGLRFFPSAHHSIPNHHALLRGHPTLTIASLVSTARSRLHFSRSLHSIHHVLGFNQPKSNSNLDHLFSRQAPLAHAPHPHWASNRVLGTRQPTSDGTPD